MRLTLNSFQIDYRQKSKKLAYLSDDRNHSDCTGVVEVGVVEEGVSRVPDAHGMAGIEGDTNKGTLKLSGECIPFHAVEDEVDCLNELSVSLNL